MAPSERSQLIGSGSAYALATAAPVLSTLLITPLVTRAFSPEDYGLIAMTIALYQVGGVLLGFGISAAITRHALMKDSGRPGAAALVVTNGTLSFLLAAILSVAAVALRYEVIPSYSSLLLVGACVSSAAFASLTGCLALLRADYAVRKFVALSVGASLGGPACGLLAVHIASRDPVIYVFAMATSQTVVAVVAMILCLRRRAISWNLGDQIDAVKFGLPTLPHQMAPSGMVTALVLIMASMQGPVAAGQVQIGFLLANGVVVILGALNNAWAPLIYKADPSHRAALLSRTSLMVSGIVVVLVATFSATIGLLAPLIAGDISGEGVVRQIAVIGAYGGVLAVYYLANIHLVFLQGKTALLALTTPAAAVMAIGIVLGLFVSSLIPFQLIGLVLPIYNAIQIAFSSTIRRKTGLPAPSLMSLTSNTLFSSALLACAFFFDPDSYMLWLCIGLLLIAAGYKNRAMLKSTKLRRNG